jgi:hypothetical protein
MPTSRFPIKRPRRAPNFPRFSDAALKAFREMKRLERKGAIADQRQWRDQRSILFGELQLKPWQFPGIQRPGTGTDLEAQARYRLLETALKQQEPVS